MRPFVRVQASPLQPLQRDPPLSESHYSLALLPLSYRGFCSTPFFLAPEKLNINICAAQEDRNIIIIIFCVDKTSGLHETMLYKVSQLA
jgi:hypothetical protein